MASTLLRVASCIVPGNSRPSTVRCAAMPGELVTDSPAQALACGFSNAPSGSHTSRTMMLPELRALLAACPRDADLATFRLAVERDNLLGKGTLATRKASFRQLRELYALDPAVPLFRALRTLWDADSAAQPLLALLCAA